MSQNIVEVAKQLAPLVREYADQGEHERHLPGPVVKAFNDAGIFRLCRPKDLGGLETDPLTTLNVIEELSRADGAAGWCAMISGAGGAFEAFVPPAGAKTMFKDPNVVVGGTFAPTGRAVAEGDGYRINGRWGIASGSGHCDWLGGSCFVFEGQAPKMGPMGPEWIVPMMSASEVKIIDTWNVSGLRGTGSNDFEVKDLLVPAERCIRIPMMESPYPGKLFAFPFFGFLASSISSVALGVARNALDEMTRLAKTKTPFGMMSTLATRASAQIAISEAETELRSARALLHDTVGKMWDDVQKSRPISPVDRAMLRAAATNATTASARAVDRAYTAGGASSIYVKSPLQRCFRDVHTITQHVFVAPHTHELFGKIIFGVEPDAPML